MTTTLEEMPDGQRLGFEEALQLLELLKQIRDLLVFFNNQTAENNVYNIYGTNIVNHGSINYYLSRPFETRSYGTAATMAEIGAAAKSCCSLMWGPSSLAVIFGMGRDMYSMQENATDFERGMSMQQLYCPPGTIANAMRNNPYLKLHVSKWASSGAKKRVLKLMEGFQKAMDEKEEKDVST